MCRVFTHIQGDQGSIPGVVIPKTQKWYVMPPCLTLYKVRIKGKVEQSREWNSALPTLWCGSYRNGSFGVTLD